MKTKVMLSMLGLAGLLAIHVPAAAHDRYRDDVRRPAHDLRYDAHYGYRDHRRHSMPRWLKRHKGFRHWYHHSRFKRHRRIAWERLWEIYTWERRHGYRYDVRVDDYGYGRGGKGKRRRKGH